MKLQEVRKAALAGVITATGVAITAYSDEVLTQAEVVIGVLTVLGAILGVYRVPNADA